MAASAQPLGLRLRVVSDSLLFVALVPLCILNALLLGYLLLIARDPDTIAHDCNHRPSCIAASDQSWTDPTLLLFSRSGTGAKVGRSRLSLQAL
jgi:hypothetical protein